MWGARLELDGPTERCLQGLLGICPSCKQHKVAGYIFISFMHSLSRTPFSQAYLGGERLDKKKVEGKDSGRGNIRLCDEQLVPTHTKECRGTMAGERSRAAPSASVPHVCAIHTRVHASWYSLNTGCRRRSGRR